MTFNEDKVEEFLGLFERSKEKIRNFEGCLHVELCRDTKKRNVFFTYSKWTSEKALNKYRNSDFFRSTWSMTKSLFAAPPEANSLDTLYSSTEKMNA